MTLTGSDSKPSTSPSVSPAKLDPERAENLAAAMRPSWEPGPPEEEAPPAEHGAGPDSATVYEAAPAGSFDPATAGLAPNQTIPLGALSSSTALSLLRAQSSRDVAGDKPRSLRPSAPEFTPRPPSAAPPAAAAAPEAAAPAAAAPEATLPEAPVTERMSSAPAHVAAARDPFPSKPPPKRVAAARRPPPSAGTTDEFKALVRKPSKGLLYGIAGVVVLGTVFVLARAGASDEPSPAAKASPPTPAVTAPTGRAAEEIPPPPPREEAALVAPTAAAAAPAPMAVQRAPVAVQRVAATPAAVERAPAPVKAPAPVRTAAPAKTTKPAAPAAAPAPQPKSAPKGGSGGIVRDTPF